MVGRRPLFTGDVTSSLPPGRPARTPSAAALWRGWAEIRADLRVSARLVLALAGAGLLAGLLWWWLAPRADFRITDTVPVAIGDPTEELFIADDSVFTLVLAAFGLVAGAAAWFLRRRRGVAVVLALALGCSLMSVLAWQLGELLGPGPSEAELADVGAVVTTELSLGSLPALAVAPFAAMLAYLLGVVYVRGDDLDRVDEPGDARLPAGDTSTAPEDRPRPDLVEIPPPGRPWG
jgi:hypothetical protein